jgi:hypothetical protein
MVGREDRLTSCAAGDPDRVDDLGVRCAIGDKVHRGQLALAAFTTGIEPRAERAQENSRGFSTGLAKCRPPLAVNSVQ